MYMRLERMQDLFENIRLLIGSAGSSMIKQINMGRKKYCYCKPDNFVFSESPNY